MILTDYKAALSILNRNRNDYILFIDEPTVGADKKDCKIVK